MALTFVFVSRGIFKALSQQHWNNAMVEEMKALDKNHTWELVDFSHGKKVVYYKWVFTVKNKVNGLVERYMAWLVTKGYTQTFGIDYQETFAPVAKMNFIRVLISLAANHN